MKAQAVVLLSAGLDSTVNLYAALKDFEIAAVVTFDYGQRAAKKEIEGSFAICKTLNLEPTILTLPWLKQITPSALVNRDVSIPQGESVQIDDINQSRVTAKAVWVPNRNGVFLNIAASVAESKGAAVVIPGFNKEEAATFPDNSADFLAALDQSFSYSTANQIKTKCYTTHLDKSEIVSMGREFEVPFDLLWPCYFDGEISDGKICGQCESCQRFLRALEAES